MIWFSVSCPFSWQCRNPSGYVAELQKLTAAAVASMSTEVDTVEEGKGSSTGRKAMGLCHSSQQETKERAPFCVLLLENSLLH